MIRLPETTRALVLRKSLVEKNPTYHDAVVEVQAIPTLKEGEILVKMAAVGFNRRDVSKESSVSLVHKLSESSLQLWIRLGQYPGISFGATLGADGAGK